MVELLGITIEVATEETAPLLAGLLESYVEELSGLFAISPGVDGRFGYDRLPLYWSNPDTHFAYYISVRDQVVGFALVTRPTDDSDTQDVAEFFVLPSHRRAGVGRGAAFLLWDRLPGRWVVRVSEANHAALHFWESATRDYTDGAVDVSTHQGRLHPFRVFAFRTT